MTTQQEYDHNRDMANREDRIEAQQAYERDYRSKGLRKPRKKRDPNRRKARDHERYLEKRDEILAKQKIYRETHKAEIRERRRKREFERVYGKRRETAAD